MPCLLGQNSLGYVGSSVVGKRERVLTCKDGARLVDVHGCECVRILRGGDCLCDRGKVRGFDVILCWRRCGCFSEIA